MASEDVIELGSSEDETEPPASKKMKPLPDAMVHIPRKLHGVTIKPMRSNFPMKHKALSGKPVVITKVPNSTTANCRTNPYRNKLNGSPLQKCIPKPVYRKFMTDKPILNQNKLNINPISVVTRGPALINRTSSASKIGKCQLKAQSPKVLNNLPSSITIKRTQGGGSSVSKVRSSTMSGNKEFTIIPPTLTVKKDLHIGRNVGDILTVELDDEGSQSSTATASPQWYLKPEEHFHESNLEMQNNKEPGTSNMIEITIDDSPVKPCLHKRACDVNNELSITIEDSPIKPLTEVASVCDSDNEQDKTKVPLSKKKLNYPEENGKNVSAINKMEIDCVPDNKLVIKNKTEEMNTLENRNLQASQFNEQDISKEDDCVTVVPLSDMIENNRSVPKDEESNDKQGKVLNDESENSSEFHPIYQRFIDLCFKLENSEDMKKIVDKKIKTYYRQVSKEYVESEEFLDMVSTKIMLMKAGPEKMFLYIKDIVDELNLQRKMAKSLPLISSNKSVEENNIIEEDTKYDNKRRRQIRKLEKTIKKLHRAIQKLEEQEVDFDDEEDSVYLLTDRYKERLMRVYAKFCQITNTKMPSEPRIQIPCQPGQPPGPARRLEKWINRKVPIGTPLPFPDFHDVLKCVREANDEDRLGWNEADIMEEARDLFTRCGRKLQRRRQENEWRLAASRMMQDVDPAENNDTLKKKLDDNKMVAAKKETELFNKYADKQNQLKLEAVEIGEKEADESPMESEEDEVNDDSNSLEDRQKRKDRLRRLLQEKSKKNSNDKGSHSNSEVRKESASASSLNQNKNDTVESLIVQENKGLEKSNKIEIRDKTKESLATNDLNATEKEDKINNENQIEVATKVEKENEIRQRDTVKEQSVVEIIDDINNVEKTVENVKVEDIESGNEVDTSNIPSVSKSQPKLYDSERIYLISDDSDADELNLLQKLHSGNEVSSPESSDYDSPIAVSDTLESNSESEHSEKYDVISIENSSYSESETAKDQISVNNIEVKCASIDNEDVICSLADECQNVDILDSVLKTEQEYTVDCNKDNDETENILLASSEDEDNTINNINLMKSGKDYINLKDDAISISETLIDEDDKKINKNDGESDCEILQKKCNINDEIVHRDIHTRSQKEVPELEKEVNVGAQLEATECIKVISKEDAVLETTKSVISDDNVPTDFMKKDNLNALESSEGNDVNMSSVIDDIDATHSKKSKLIEPEKSNSVEQMLEEMFNVSD